MGKKPDDPEPTAQEQAASQVAVEQWNEYVDHWSEPVQNWAQGIAKDKAPEMAQVTGITNADIAQQGANLEHSIGKGGMSPNSGKMMSGVADATTMDGKVGASAAVDARQGVENSQLEGLGQVAAIGMGQKATATQGIQDIAATSVQKSMADSASDQQKKYDTANLVGGAAGVAAGVYTSMQSSDSGIKTNTIKND